MKKKLLYIIVLLLALVFVLASCNDSSNADGKGNNDTVAGTTGLAYTQSADGKGCIVSGIGTASADHIVIPSTFGGKPVVGIGEKAFEECTSFSSITIPDTVTSIRSFAFNRCKRLASVNFGENSQLESIGENAFYDCDDLTSFTFPDTLKSIGAEAFYDCSNLTNITLPDSVTSIGRVAFSSTPDYIKMWDKGAVYFGKHLLMANASLAFTIKEGTLCIADEAFSTDTLVSITIPASVKSIGENAFYYCRYLKKVTFKENSQIQSISSSAFDCCDSLETVTFGDNGQFTSIGTAFNGNESLKTVIFGANSQMTHIDGYAFFDCFELESIHIPKAVTSIGQLAFYNCYDLAHIYYEGTMEEWKAIRKGTQWDLYSGDYTVYCSDGNLTK